MKELIKQKVDLIAECIFSRIENLSKKEDSYGLYSGEFGVLLFLFYYSRYSKNKNHYLKTENYAESLFNRFFNETTLHTFCGGISGVLYLFEFLRENDFIDIDVSASQSLLDHYLISRMRLDIRQEYYDFMHGALGVGLYFLKKGSNHESIKSLIDFLYQIAEKDADNQIFKWKSIINPEKNSIGYNLSLSHGIASIIIFLSRAVDSGIKDEIVMEMLTGAVNYELSQQRNFSQFGFHFPNYIISDSQDTVSKSRLAWCYGDLGIGIALWQAGKVIDNANWKEKGLEVLLQSVQRQKSEYSSVIDAGICHGSAGLAMIFRRMYLETGRNEFKDAVNHWLYYTLHMARFEDGLAGYKTFIKDEWICDYSLLNGISGIGLVLLTYLEDDKQTWDEIFLIS